MRLLPSDSPAGARQPIPSLISSQGTDLQDMAAFALGSDPLTLLSGPALVELEGPVAQGERLTLTLPSNPSTGYAWTVEGQDGQVLASLRDEMADPPRAGLGTPGQQVLQFRATRDGTARLRLAYGRPWKRFAAPARTISIQALGLNLKDVCSALIVPLSPAPAGPPAPSGERTGEQSAGEQEATSTSLPAAYDWCAAHGGCPPVRDQGSCGSCWAFATAGPLEAWIRAGNGLTGIDLSEQYLLSCNVHGWNCGGGWFAHDYHWDYAPPGEVEAGAVLESSFGYAADDTLPCASPYAHSYQITSWSYLADRWSVPSAETIQQAILDHGPVAAAVCVGPVFRSYSGGLFATDESAACSGGINHAITLVGWGEQNGQRYWILRNSWGPGWGEDGYMNIRWGTSNVGYAANAVTYTATPFEASSWVYLPLALRDLRAAVSDVANGDFERGRDGSWQESSSNGWPLILRAVDLPLDPHGGEWAAWLGGDHDETSILSQEVVVPAGVTHLTYWYWIASEDFCGWDETRVYLGSNLLRSHDLCELNNSAGWIQDQIALQPDWQGQAMDLRFVVETDGSLLSSFFLDDVSMAPSAARPRAAGHSN